MLPFLNLSHSSCMFYPFFFFQFSMFFSLHLRMESFSWFIFKLTYSLLHCELHNCLSSDRAPQSASNSHCLPCLQPSLSISLKPWPQLSIFFLPLFDSARVEWAGWEKFTSSSYSRTLTNSFPFQSTFFFFFFNRESLECISLWLLYPSVRAMRGSFSVFLH